MMTDPDMLASYRRAVVLAVTALVLVYCSSDDDGRNTFKMGSPVTEPCRRGDEDQHGTIHYLEDS